MGDDLLALAQARHARLHTEVFPHGALLNEVHARIAAYTDPLTPADIFELAQWWTLRHVLVETIRTMPDEERALVVKLGYGADHFRVIDYWQRERLNLADYMHLLRIYKAVPRLRMPLQARIFAMLDELVQNPKIRDSSTFSDWIEPLFKLLVAQGQYALAGQLVDRQASWMRLAWFTSMVEHALAQNDAASARYWLAHAQEYCDTDWWGVVASLLIALAQLLYQQGQLEQALFYLKQAEQSHASPTQTRRLALIYLHMGDWTAVEYWQAAYAAKKLNMNAADAMALEDYQTALSRIHAPETIVRFVGLTEQTFIDTLELGLLAAKRLIELGAPQASVRLLIHVAEFGVFHDRMEAIVLLYQLGELEHGAYLTGVLETDATNEINTSRQIQLLTNLVLMWLQIGDEPQAVRLMRKLMMQTGLIPEIHEAFVAFWLKKGDIEKARQLIQTNLTSWNAYYAVPPNTSRYNKNPHSWRNTRNHDPYGEYPSLPDHLRFVTRCAVLFAPYDKAQALEWLAGIHKWLVHVTLLIDGGMEWTLAYARIGENELAIKTLLAYTSADVVHLVKIAREVHRTGAVTLARQLLLEARKRKSEVLNQQPNYQTHAVLRKILSDGAAAVMANKGLRPPVGTVLIDDANHIADYWQAQSHDGLWLFLETLGFSEAVLETRERGLYWRTLRACLRLMGVFYKEWRELSPEEA